MSENLPVKNAAIIEFGTIAPGAMLPRNFEGLYRMSEIFAASGLMPKGIDTPASVFVAITMGLEVGLSPMQAVQNIAVINNRPCLWGDSVLALVRASGLLEDFDETDDGETATCTAYRKGQTKPIIRKFSMSDARQAELAGKSGPWKQYPKRMRQMRARSWTLRDGFGDVLKGLHVAEEVQDYDIELKQSTSGAYVQEMLADDGKPTIDELFTIQFEKQVADLGISFAEVDRFVAANAARKKCSVEALKEAAIKEPVRFMAAFGKEMAKQMQTGTPGKKADMAEPPKPILCPSQKKGVLPEECAGCAASEKCDQYAEWKYDAAQKGE